MLQVDGNGLPLSIDLDSASRTEVKLIVPLIDQAIMRYVPERLADRGIELICPHRQGRVRPDSQDGRALRRYRHRWVVERTISWLQFFRSLVTRYEYYDFLFHSFAKTTSVFVLKTGLETCQ